MNIDPRRTNIGLTAREMAIRDSHFVKNFDRSKKDLFVLFFAAFRECQNEFRAVSMLVSDRNGSSFHA